MNPRDNEKCIDYIEFGATDIEATRAFYQQVFGWRFEDYGPDYTSFFDGRLAGGFKRVDAVGAASPLIVLFAEDLAAMKARVEEAGGTIVRDVFSFPGGQRFHLADPSGNELAVWSDAEDS
jgi:predicted enzyme related to lactoylglutathione lyase